MFKLILDSPTIWKKATEFLPDLVANDLIEQLLEKLFIGSGLEASMILAKYNEELAHYLGPASGATIINPIDLCISPCPELIITIKYKGPLEIRFSNPTMIIRGLMKLYLLSLFPKVIFEGRSSSIQQALIDCLQLEKN